MEPPAVTSQTSTLNAYAVQGQDRRSADDSGSISRRVSDSARVAEQPGEKVTLSRESRDIAVQEADRSRRPDATRQQENARAQETVRQDQGRQPAANEPRSVTQALEAYTRNALI